jgi:methylthioribose-1-phosphate isomerase
MVAETLDNTRLDAGYLPLEWTDNKLLILDQRRLPEIVEYFSVNNLKDTCFAIKDMVVRGAPSIGVTASYGFALEACRLLASSLMAGSADAGTKPIIDTYEKLFPISSLAEELKNSSLPDLSEAFAQLKATLDSTRPTAVNLRWGTDRMLSFCSALLHTAVTLEQFGSGALSEAQKILEEHIQTNIKLSQFGLEIVPHNANFITHCNAGPLAACGWGTALGVIRTAHADGRKPHVFVDETRPRNQGAKLTMWELVEDKIPATLVCDNMSGFLMANKKIDLVVVGADRIARNGDAANKIGTYNLAIVANYHNVPFYIAAPLSTFDATIFNGSEIPIEERSPNEITGASESAENEGRNHAFNPAFDVTPNHLIAGIITEAGILRPPYNESIKRALGIN